MKNLISISFLIGILCFVSCQKTSPSFTGKWIVNDTIIERPTNYFQLSASNFIEISQTSKENYIFTFRHNKYPALLKDRVLNVNIDQNNMQVVFDDANQLIFDGETFIKFEESHLYKLLGIWVLAENPENTLKDKNLAIKISIDEEFHFKITWGEYNDGKFIPDELWSGSNNIQMHGFDALEGTKINVTGSDSYKTQITLMYSDGYTKIRYIEYGNPLWDPTTTIVHYSKKENI